MKLENWSLVVLGDMYTPPECQVTALRGKVYGHPRHEDGTTSPVLGIKVQTQSGSEYELGG